MDFFNYKNNIIHAEDVSITDLVKTYPTPFYLYSKATIERHYRLFDEALKLDNKKICYAVKANSNDHVLKILAANGSGADVVSKGEIEKALAAGIKAQDIVYSGVGKKKTEIAFAIDQNIFQFNTESKEEIFMIDEIARSKNKIQDIVLRINPNVDAKTNSKISTGKKGDKFGIDLAYVPEVLKEIRNLKNINFRGLSVHIGSQITEIAPFAAAFKVTIDFAKSLLSDGYKIDRIDFGGGVGVPYGDNKTISIADYAEVAIAAASKLPGMTYIFEPGRLLVANAGILVTQVILVKRVAGKSFVIIDSAMNDLLRPALYSALHQVLPVVQDAEKEREACDIVGPVCETSDVFVRDILFQKQEADDYLIIKSSGAYGAVMASTYNARPLILEYVVDGNNILT
ncbi:MAG: diaminopimelate decarboxylase [Rickettsiales bacterium]|nr:diaminopimelate decarboxylase [Rickettsiales bacterium]